MVQERQRSWRVIGVVTACLLGLSVAARGQDESTLKSFFEGKRVELRIDMPGTSDGVDIHPGAREPLDYGHYRGEIEKYETAIRAGDRATVTLVKVKKDLIEFQLAGGGFGTFWDDTSTTVSMPLVEKSEREKKLEERLRDEEDRERRKELRRELDDLREHRERENRRILAEREAAEERKIAKVAAERRAGGSRFNIRYDGGVPAGIHPEDVMAALVRYVDFGADARTVEMGLPSPTAGGSPRVGMPRSEAERLFGKPVESFDRWDGTRNITLVVFDTGGERITAEFADKVLVRYTVMSK